MNPRNTLLTVLASIFIATMSTVRSTSAKEVAYRSDIVALQYNDVWNRFGAVDFHLRYDTDEDAVIIAFEDGITTVALLANGLERHGIRPHLEKFLEWHAKAIEKQVTLEKEIGRARFDFAVWSVGRNWNGTQYYETSFSFFSQNENHHQLVWLFGEMQSLENEYITHAPDALYFEVDQVTALLEALDEETIDAFAAEQERQAEIEAEFQ